VRTDFYELYWADLTAGSTWEEFTAWFWDLLWRPLKRVPRDVRPAWVLLWIAALCVLALAVLSLLPSDFWKYIGVEQLANWHWLLLLVSAILARGLHKTASKTFARVAPLHESRSRQHRGAAKREGARAGAFELDS
jgi:hypothetical protein